jgi:ABC-type glycerol-3-phosphate transport system permease component
MVKKDKGFQISANIIMMLLSLICLIPFILMFVSSVTDENILLQNGYSFFPEKLSLDTYRFLFNSSGSNIWNAYGITVVVTVIGTVAIVLSAISKRFAASPCFQFYSVLYHVIQWWSGAVLYHVDSIYWHQKHFSCTYCTGSYDECFFCHDNARIFPK